MMVDTKWMEVQTLANYQQLNDDIVCIDTEQHRPGMAACYLIGNEGHYAFVESGTSRSVPHILDALAELGVARTAVDYVMPTHVHLDHAGGTGALIRELPNARLVIHPRGAKHMIDPSRLIAAATAVYGPEVMRATYGEIVPVPEARVIVADVAADRDFTFALGNRPLLFIDAPGHARHHYAIWDATSRGWFTGDVFGVSYRDFDDACGNFIVPPTSPNQFDPAAWEATLRRLLAKSPVHVYLTHYGRVDAVPVLARELREGLSAYQRIARAHAGAPDRHAHIHEGLMDHHLAQLRERRNPQSPARARELLGPDVEVFTQGLETWLDQQAADAVGAATASRH
ncbi:MAG: MBL fold metallo-hydrolase [Rhodanobacteraceae bacterium]